MILFNIVLFIYDNFIIIIQCNFKNNNIVRCRIVDEYFLFIKLLRFFLYYEDSRTYVHEPRVNKNLTTRQISKS